MTLIERLSSLFKSKNIEVAGNWTGSYVYSEQYPQSLLNQRVQFFAKIHADQQGYFTGTIKESEEGVPETAKIEGQVNGRKIAFTKIYEKLYQVDETGKHIISDGPQHIFYRGFYEDSSKSFVGDWRIEGTYIMSNGREIGLRV